MAAPVDPYPDLHNLVDIVDATFVNARFRRLYDALDKTKVGLDANSFKDGAFTAAKFTQPAWSALTLTGSTWAPTTLAYYKDALGLVRLRSELFASTVTTMADGTVLGVFPGGYKPVVKTAIQIARFVGGGWNTPGIGWVDTDGTLTMGTQGAGGYGVGGWVLYGSWRAES